MYEGWSKLKVLITASDVEAAKVEQEDRKMKVKRRGKTKAKTSSLHDEDEEDEEIVDWPTFANNYDVVITTFAVLQSDLTVARAPVIRPRRSSVPDSFYSSAVRPRSPLVMLEWARVIMDEVQLVGDGKAAEMMSLVPRLSSLAVSGTPAKKSVDDLVQVLR